ncbi:HNRNP arginine N-methyltransferase, putative, partial [Entamoeba invadens IP1]
RVLVVQCGFGKLALLAKKYKARYVKAIDTRTIAQFFRHVVDELKVDIVVEQTSISEVKEKYDIIICDWMGINLYYDSLLSEMLIAKTKLKKCGEILPSGGKCYICGVTEINYVDEQYEFWKDVYGFDMSIMLKGVVCTAYIDNIDESKVITSKHLLYGVDLNDFEEENLTPRTVKFSITLKRQMPLVGFCTYFDCDVKNKKISSAPGKKTTWKQCCYLCPSPMNGKIDDVITGRFKMLRKKGRWMVQIQYECKKRQFEGTFPYVF